VNRFDFGPDVLELDHLKPISKGGKSTVANVVVSCLSCNRGRNNRPSTVLAEVA
jgi:5-methylcytosine-specific restriction endonuclease McrA